MQTSNRKLTPLGMVDCVPFVLDMSKIELRTTDKKLIRLPYNGPLPVEFEGAANPYISLFVRPGDVRVCLFAERDGKKISESLDATPEEINDLLWGFFYKPGKKKNVFVTRFDNGLDKYWLGCYQTEYGLWKRITLESYMPTVVRFLPEGKRTQTMKALQRLEQEER